MNYKNTKVINNRFALDTLLRGSSYDVSFKNGRCVLVKRVKR